LIGQYFRGIVMRFVGKAVFRAIVTAVPFLLIQSVAASAQQADLAITKTDGATTATAGGSLTYTITASNAGPNDAPGATVADTFPAVLTGATWTCVGAGGGTCTPSGSGNINRARASIPFGAQ
jgi:uncharacterized repeat protein (TIGR01451 family)